MLWRNYRSQIHFTDAEYSHTHAHIEHMQAHHMRWHTRWVQTACQHFTVNISNQDSDAEVLACWWGEGECPLFIYPVCVLLHLVALIGGHHYSPLWSPWLLNISMCRLNRSLLKVFLLNTLLLPLLWPLSNCFWYLHHAFLISFQ